eukprot:scaffold300_cov258-Pinguiococcus_pyrenoidosus.AAC.50
MLRRLHAALTCHTSFSCSLTSASTGQHIPLCMQRGATREVDYRTSNAGVEPIVFGEERSELKDRRSCG